MPENPIILLSIFTLVAVLAFGAWQLRSVRRSQARHGEEPGDVTMTRHAPVEAPAVEATAASDLRTAAGGDVASYKRQDAEANAAVGPDAKALRASLDKAVPTPVA